MDEYDSLERALKTQIGLCKDSWEGIVQKKVLPSLAGSRPTALDVGCGPGFVMDIFSDHMDVMGVDRSAEMAKWAAGRSHSVIQGLGEELPFSDGAFDIVYCSFTLTWVKDPERFIGEMLRVSRKWVLCLAESDADGRIDHPDTLNEYTKLVRESVVKVGGNARMGRELGPILRRLGQSPEVGVNGGGVHKPQEIGQWLKDEWNWVEEVLRDTHDKDELERVKVMLYEEIERGTVLHFTPLFYAIVEKDSA